MQFSNKQFKFVALGLVLLVLWLGWRYALARSLSLALSERAQPRVEVTETVWDFGTVLQTTPLKFEFPVSNTGNRRLVLVRQSQSCDCLSGMEPEVVISSRSQRKLTLTLDARRLYGSVSEQYRYHTNDPDCPTLTFTFLGNVQPDGNEVDSNAK